MIDGEPLHEIWLRFQKLLLQCPRNGVPDNLLLQYFYMSLDTINKGITDQLVRGDLMKQSFEVASALLDDLTKVNRVWYTIDDHVSPLLGCMTKEKDGKNRERDANMTKMLSQMNFITNWVMGNEVEEINAIATRRRHVLESPRVDSYPSHSTPDRNQGRNIEDPRVGSYPGYSTPDENQGWRNDWEGQWKEREW